MQEIEVLGLRKLLRFGDALGEGIPRHDGLDGGERIAARLLGLDQRLADAAEQPHLGVDRLAGRLELLLMLVLGGVEQLAQDAVVQVDDFVGDGGHALDGKRHRGGIASLRLELGQSAGVIWPPSRAILSRRFWCTDRSMPEGRSSACHALRRSMCSSMCREFGLTGDWRSQPASRRFAVVPTLEQIVEAAAMRVRQRFGQGIVDAPVGAGDCFGARPLDGVEGRQNDRLLPQVLDQGAGQHDALVGLQGHLGQQLDGLPVVAHGKGLEAEHRLQFDQCSRRVCSRCPYSSQLSTLTLSWSATSFNKGGNGGSSTPRMTPESAGNRAARRSPAGWPGRAAAG